MKLKIGVKIFISFFVITSLIILVSVIGLIGMYSVNSSYGVIVNENIPVEILVKEVRSINLEQVATVRGYMVYREEQFTEQYNSLSDRLNLVFKEIEGKARTTESQEFLKALKTSHDEYDKGVQVVFDKVRNGEMDEAIALGTTVKENVDDIKRITEDWSTYVKNIDAQAIDKTENNIKARISILLIIVIITVLGAVLVGYMLTRNIARPIKALTTIAGRISEGDLTQQIPEVRSKDEIRELGHAFSNMVLNLRTLIVNVSDASQELVASSEELAASSGEVSKVSEQIAITVSELARGASEQAVSSEKGNAKILDTVEGLARIAEEMSASEKIMQQAKEVVKNGEESVRYQEQKVKENNETSLEVADAISELSDKSQEIGKILEVIRSISDQTNLLALNAAIEAARAGEAGKGFSVVADEIRKLAEQSSLSVKQIDTIIREVQSGVNSAVVKMDKSKAVAIEQSASLVSTVAAFDNIAEVVENINSKILMVAGRAQDLSRNAVQAGDEITGIASVAQQTAASTQEVAAATEEQSSTVHQITEAAEGLTQLALQLQDGIRKFNV